MNMDWSANSVCSQLNMHTHTLFTWVLNTTYSSSLPGRQPHSVIQSLHDAGSLVDFLSLLYEDQIQQLLSDHLYCWKKMSLNNSPHIYTRMKKNKVISIKIPLRKGDNKVHSRPQSTIHMISYWTEITDSPAGNKSLGQSIWPHLL